MKTTVLITSYNEPKTVAKAIYALKKQTISTRIILSAPDEPTLKVGRNLGIDVFKDKGVGKSSAINQILKTFQTDILILTDGDVYVSNNAVEEILKLFKDKKIGCVTGRPVPQEDKSTKFGYFANFLFDAAHNLRKKAFENQNFIECSGYFFAFRKKEIKEIPGDVAEDTIIPYYFAEKGFKNSYAEKARVYVKNVDNWKDWFSQKVRTAKGHENLGKYVDINKTKKVKSFSTESKGISMLFTYPKNIKQFFWTIQLIFARLYMWWGVKKDYKDGWGRISSTK